MNQSIKIKKENVYNDCGCDWAFSWLLMFKLENVSQINITWKAIFSDHRSEMPMIWEKQSLWTESNRLSLLKDSMVLDQSVQPDRRNRQNWNHWKVCWYYCWFHWFLSSIVTVQPILVRVWCFAVDEPLDGIPKNLDVFFSAVAMFVEKIHPVKMMCDK